VPTSCTFRRGCYLSAVTKRALPEKTCASCGRRIVWRKKWERSWDEVRYCSERCRTRRDLGLDAQMEDAILTLLAERATTSSICPSDAARRAAGEDDWRPLMETARAAARRLVARNLIEVTQRGQVVDPSTAKGPIRLRRRRGTGGPMET